MVQVILFTRNKKKSPGVQERPNGSSASCGVGTKVWKPHPNLPSKNKPPKWEDNFAFYLRPLESSTMNLDLRLDKNDI